ncbi:unnamed protein product [Caretta caretta]
MTYGTFITRQLVEKNLERNVEHRWAFLDLEKEHDKVPRLLLRPLLQFYGVPEELLQMVISLYNGSITKVWPTFGVMKGFEINAGDLQESALSPLLFIIVVDFISKQIQMDGGMKLLYADDIVLMVHTEEDLVQAIDAWNRELTNYGLKMSKEKTEVMWVTHAESR